MYVSPGPKSDEDSKQELLALENRWLQVENDPVGFEGILAPDFLARCPGGKYHEGPHTFSFLREHPAGGQRPEKHFGRSACKGFTVKQELGEWCRDRNDRAWRAQDLFTDVFACRDGKWQAVSAQELPVTGP